MCWFAEGWCVAQEAPSYKTVLLMELAVQLAAQIPPLSPLHNQCLPKITLSLVVPFI